MSSTFKFAIAAMVLSFVAPAAMAGPTSKEASARVTYGDIDLSSPSGGAKLLKRIEIGARRACSDANVRSPLRPRGDSACQREAVETAVRNLNIETLSLAWAKSQPDQVQFSAR